jgi:hypothetical protein
MEIVGFLGTVRIEMPYFLTFVFIVFTEETPKAAMISFHPQGFPQYSISPPSAPPFLKIHPPPVGPANILS